MVVVPQAGSRSRHRGPWHRGARHRAGERSGGEARGPSLLVPQLPGKPWLPLETQQITSFSFHTWFHKAAIPRLPLRPQPVSCS